MPKRILVVDDDEAIREMLSDVLQDEGYEVITASNGLTALLKLVNRLPDLIVLDLMMPLLNGYEFMHELHNRKYPAPPAVLVFSAHIHHKQEVEHLGVDACCAKPGDLDTIVSQVQRLIGLPRALFARRYPRALQCTSAASPRKEESSACVCLFVPLTGPCREILPHGFLGGNCFPERNLP